MSVRYDILLDSDGDLPIETNALGLAQSDQRHITDCTISFPGYWKQNPFFGVGIGGYLNSSGQKSTIEKQAKYMLSKDGYATKPKLIVVSGDNLVVDQSKVVIV